MTQACDEARDQRLELVEVLAVNDHELAVIDARSVVQPARVSVTKEGSLAKPRAGVVVVKRQQML
eukprot:scaffold3499_cov117-Isochrysis_galbana.AAC.8